MRRRVYWLLPDLPGARATMEDLLLAGIALRSMHFVGREDCDMAGLHAANLLQTSDVVRSAETGLVSGAAVGGMLGAMAAVHYAGVGDAPQWNLIPTLVAAGALVEAWTASMIGISAPNKLLERYAVQIDSGRILLMVDVPTGRVAEIEARLQALHPRTQRPARDPGMPSFP